MRKMKIKTIIHEDPTEYDRQVNVKLEQGWILEHKELEAVHD